MAMSWFRLHSEARNDRKLATLTDSQFRVWFNLLCLSSESKQRGTITFESRELLALEVSGGDESLLESTITVLRRLRIIESELPDDELEIDGHVAFVHWNERQYDKPSDTPEAVNERVTKHRERVRNADVTPTKRDVTPCNATYTDTDTDTDTEQNGGVPPVTPQTAAKSKKTDPKPRATRMTTDWQPPETFTVWATGHGYQSEFVTGELEKFRDYFANTGKPGLDWPAAFRNWLRRASEFAPKPINGAARASPNGRPSSDDVMAEAQRIIERKRNGPELIDVSYRIGGGS